MSNASIYNLIICNLVTFYGTVNWNLECNRNILKLAYTNKVIGEVEGVMEVEINKISEYVQLGMVLATGMNTNKQLCHKREIILNCKLDRNEVLVLG